MCGIAGIIRTTPPNHTPAGIPDELIHILDEHIAWRGPDGHATFRDAAIDHAGNTIEIALIHRRLAIIDLETGHQPMVAPSPDPDNQPDDVLAVVLNGCIYNHRELREALTRAGHHFTTSHADTEVLLHLARQLRSPSRPQTDAHLIAPDDEDDELNASPFNPEHALTIHLEGMYALAIWDRAIPQLTLARDPHGEKPLYITRRADGITAFASTIDALAALNTHLGWRAVQTDWRTQTHQKPPRTRPANQRQPLDPHATLDWFAFGWSSLHAPHAGIEPIAPATTTTLIATKPGGNIARFALGFLLLTAAIPIIAVASLILATAAVVIWLALALPYLLILLLPIPAGLILRATGKPSPTRRVQREERLLDTTDAFIATAVRSMLEADVPVGLFLSGGVDSSLIAHHACAAAGPLPAFCVRMPDEAYDESPYARIAAETAGAQLHLIDPPADILTDLEQLTRLIGAPFADSSILPSWWLASHASQHIKVALSGDGADEYFLGYERQRVLNLLRWAGPLLALYPTRTLDRSNPKSRSAKLARLIEAARHAGYVDLIAIFNATQRARALRTTHRGVLTSYKGDATIAFDTLHYLPGDILTKTDTASMAAHIEVRAPFLASQLTTVASNISDRNLRLHNLRKGLLRAIARRHFPDAIIDRPKMGFAIPIGRWFRDDHAAIRTRLMDELASAEPFPIANTALDLDIDAIRQMVTEHDRAEADHAQRLFLLLTLAIWSQHERERLQQHPQREPTAEPITRP